MKNGSAELKNYPEVLVKPLVAVWRKLRSCESISRDDLVDLIRTHFAIDFVPNLDLFKPFVNVQSVVDSPENLVTPVLLSIFSHLYNIYGKPITLVKITDVKSSKVVVNDKPLLCCQALPIISSVSPGLAFDLYVPLHAYLRFLTACKASNFYVRNLTHTSGLYCYLGSNKKSLVKWLAITKELVNINVKILSYKFGKSIKDKPAQCRFCGRIHNGFNEDCKLLRKDLKLPDVLDELVVLMRR